jgi:hypothetical protein
MDNPRTCIGIPTGIRRYDQSIGGGLRPNSLDIIAARAKVGKTQIVDNIAINIAGKLGIPVLNIDTEMSLEEHLHRVVANLSGIEIREIETGKFKKHQVAEGLAKLKDMPYYYECVIGKPFEELLAGMRRWITRTVGLDDNGRAKPCVIIYDYLKMMSADFLSSSMQEYQALGFITTALKNFVGRYNTSCLTFAQLNREGIDKEDTSVISGSDRIIHYATSLTIYKKKSYEERAEAVGGEANKYTHKLLPLICRHGEGMDSDDYINIQADYKRGRIIEGPTKKEIEAGIFQVGQPQGIVVDEGKQRTVAFN